MRGPGKQVINQKFGMTRAAGYGGGSQSRIPSGSNKENQPHSNQEIRKLTPQELQYMRSNGLCFRCGDRYTVGHQCKVKQLNLLMNEEEEEDFSFEDTIGEQDENTGNPRKMMDISLNTLSGSLKRKTIMLQGELLGIAIQILVDTGSSDSFISHHLARQLDLPFFLSRPFTITMADGSGVTGSVVCPKVPWRIQH